MPPTADGQRQLAEGCWLNGLRADGVLDDLPGAEDVHGGTPALDGGIDLLHDAGRFEEAAEEDQGFGPLQGGEGQVEGHVVLGVVAGEATQYCLGFFEPTFFLADQAVQQEKSPLGARIGKGGVQGPVRFQRGSGLVGLPELVGAEGHDVDAAELGMPVFTFRSPEEVQAALRELPAAGGVDPTDGARLFDAEAAFEGAVSDGAGEPHGIFQDVGRLFEVTQVGEQRGGHREDVRFLVWVSASFLQALGRGVEGFLGTGEVAGATLGIAEVGPGACPEVVDALFIVRGRREKVGDRQGRVGEIETFESLLRGRSLRLRQEKVEHAPSVEIRVVADCHEAWAWRERREMIGPERAGNAPLDLDVVQSQDAGQLEPPQQARVVRLLLRLRKQDLPRQLQAGLAGGEQMADDFPLDHDRQPILRQLPQLILRDVLHVSPPRNLCPS